MTPRRIHHFPITTLLTSTSTDHSSCSYILALFYGKTLDAIYDAWRPRIAFRGKAQIPDLRSRNLFEYFVMLLYISAHRIRRCLGLRVEWIY